MPHRPFNGAKLILTCGDGLLVLLRDDNPAIRWPGWWDLPGGGRKGEESPLDCGLRELLEETGLTLAPARLQGEARPSVARPGRLSWMFRAELTEAEAGAVRLGNEGQDLRLMPLAEYLSHPRAIPHFREMVREVLSAEAVRQDSRAIATARP